MEETAVFDALAVALEEHELGRARQLLGELGLSEVRLFLDRMPKQARAVGFRLLGKDAALVVFEQFSPAVQKELIESLGEEETSNLFDELDPDDRVELLDELPAVVAKRLVQRLTPNERELTSTVLGYRKGSIGRRMSPEYVSVRADQTVSSALDRIRLRGRESETIYTIPVVDDSRVLLGVVELDDLFLADGNLHVQDFMQKPVFAYALDDGEETARRFLDLQLLAMPIVDGEKRLVGLLTIDDAVRIYDAASAEDAARAGASEPLDRPYLQTPVRLITKSRIVWLFVLGISAILTVNVLDLFQATLEQRIALSLFIPLLTGIGGNTGSQAATTLTRAIAMGEASIRDIGKVAFKEFRTGVSMGLILGIVGFLLATLIYDLGIGTVIGLTLLAICSISAVVGGCMPIVAKAMRVDPAVFSTPFISTFCDATGLLLYFTIAKAVLGI